MACDDDVLPLQERIESAADTSELEEVYNTSATFCTLPALEHGNTYSSQALIPRLSS